MNQGKFGVGTRGGAFLLFSVLLSLFAIGCGDDTAETPSPEDASDGDASLPDGDGVSADVDTGDGNESDGDADGEEVDGDAVEGSARRILYRICETDSDCPTSGTTCLGVGENLIQWSHKGAEGRAPQSLAVTATDLFGAGAVPPGSGVCSASCAGQSDCSSIAGIGTPSAPWSCQVVAVGDSPYSGIGDEVDDDAMEAGQPFAAICRPPSLVAAALPVQDLCAPCSFGCSEQCVNPADGTVAVDGAGVCSNNCSSDDDCAIGFACSSAGLCAPNGATCSDCYDPDGDGVGVGKCGDNGAKTPFDCDQSNADIYFSISGGRVRSPSGAVDQHGALYCSSSEDSNCNGVADIDEMVGPAAEYAATFKQFHCTGCNDSCRDEDIPGGVDGTANAAAECKCPDGNPECAPSEAECVIGCADGYLDCGGPKDCETSAASVASCGSCDNDCNLVGDDASANVSEVSCDEIIEEGVSVYTCGLSCKEGFADCNGDFSDGCEVDLSVGVDLGDGRVEHCGSCTDPSTASPDPSLCGDLTTSNLAHTTAFACLDGRCAVAACEANFGDCDGALGEFLPGGYSSACEANLTTYLNCGACHNHCESGPRVERADCLEKTSGNYECAISVCVDGFQDCNQIASDGCEFNADGFSLPTSCGGCANDCRVLLADFSDPEATAVCNWRPGDPETNTLDYCEVRCDPTDVTTCGGCGNDCTTLDTPGANLESVSCSFVEGDDAYQNNDPGLTSCEVDCAPGFASCSNTDGGDGDPRTCETNITTNDHCGGCGQVCSVEGFPDSSVQQVDCVVAGGSGQASCECVDAAPTQICNGKRTICDEAVDEGCPTTLRFADALTDAASEPDDLSILTYALESPPTAFRPQAVTGDLRGRSVESSHPLVGIRPLFAKDVSGDWQLLGLNLEFQPFKLVPYGLSGSAFSGYRLVEDGPAIRQTLKAYNAAVSDLTETFEGEYVTGREVTCADNTDGEPASVNGGEKVLLPVGFVIQYFEDDRFGATPDRVSGIGLECRYFEVKNVGDGRPGDYKLEVADTTRFDVPLESKLSSAVPASELYIQRITVGSLRKVRPISQVRLYEPLTVAGLYEETDGSLSPVNMLMLGLPLRFPLADARVSQPDPRHFTWFGLVTKIQIGAFHPRIE